MPLDFFLLSLSLSLSLSQLAFTHSRQSRAREKQRAKRELALRRRPSSQIMFRKADSSGDLAPAVERLHALADRLEVREIDRRRGGRRGSIRASMVSLDSPSSRRRPLLCQPPFSPRAHALSIHEHRLKSQPQSVLSKVVVAGGAAAAGAASAAANHGTPAMPPPSTSSPSSSSSSSCPLSDWASRVAPALARLRDACSLTAGDPEIESLTRVLEDAFRAEEAVLREVAAAPSRAPPDDAALERLLAPVAAAAEEARELANPPGGRGRAAPRRLNQAKAVSELIPALLWVAYSGPSCGTKGDGRRSRRKREREFFFFGVFASSRCSLLFFPSFPLSLYLSLCPSVSLHPTTQKNLFLSLSLSTRQQGCPRRRSTSTSRGRQPSFSRTRPPPSFAAGARVPLPTPGPRLRG